MKRLLLSLAMVLLTAGLVHAGAIGFNDQEQTQIDGGFGFDIPGENGQFGVGGSFQTQNNEGFGLSDGGDTAFDAQFEAQGTNDGFAVYGGADNFQTTWDADQQMSGEGTTTFGGAYGYEGDQFQGGVAAGANNEQGSASIAGSAYLGASEVDAAAFSGETHVIATQQYEQSYSQTNDGGDNSITQAGYQDVEMGARADVWGTGADSGSAYVAQGGGTAAVNNDLGTYQAGGGVAVAEAGGTGDHYAEGFQVHAYENVNNEGGSTQYQTGAVGTFVQSN